MSVVKRTSTNVLLDIALKNFYAAAEEMGLEEELVEILSHSDRKLAVSIPVIMDDGTVCGEVKDLKVRKRSESES